MPARIEARDLVVTRAGAPILKRASIAVAASSIATLEGPSGSGKSTLLKAMATLIPWDAGTVYVDGVDATTLEPTAFRRRVAYVPQEPRMLDGTVADNLATGPRLAGRRLSPDRVRELVTKVALPAGFEARDTRDLSGGERQRVALARALANEPSAILLDEPTAALDPGSARKILELTVALASTGLAVVVVTHVEDHAAFLGDRPEGARYRCRDGEVTAIERGS